MAERIKLSNEKYWDSTGIVTNAAGETLDTTLSNLHVELTQAEYDAQPSAQKNNGTVYFITDAEAPDAGITIDDIAYALGPTTTARALSCAWADYDLLSFNPVCYGNRLSGSVVVPSSWFYETNANNSVVLWCLFPNPMQATSIVIYQNGNNSIMFKQVYQAGQQPQNCGVDVLGIKLAT